MNFVAKYNKIPKTIKSKRQRSEIEEVKGLWTSKVYL